MQLKLPVRGRTLGLALVVLVLVAVFAYVLLGERPSLQEWLGIALVAGGVLLIALHKTPAGI